MREGAQKAQIAQMIDVAHVEHIKSTQSTQSKHTRGREPHTCAALHIALFPLPFLPTMKFRPAFSCRHARAGRAHISAHQTVGRQ